MKIFQLQTTSLQTNTYIVQNGNKGFVVDPGGDYEKIKEKIDRNGIDIEAVLLTHGHFDHANSALFFQQNNAKVFCHENDLEKLTTFRGMAFWGGVQQNKVTADVVLHGGETLNVAGLKIEVVWTPGHSLGSVCYIVEDKIFCGDTIFLTSYGRTDFYDGSHEQIKESIEKIFAIEGDKKLLPGHGEMTTLDFERKNNMILFE